MATDNALANSHNPSGHTREEFYSNCVHFTQVKDGVIITACIVDKRVSGAQSNTSLANDNNEV